MKGRLYDPKLRRFITPDPFVTEPFNPQGLNRYSYVQNNPVTFVDPTGFQYEGCTWPCVGPVTGEGQAPAPRIDVGSPPDRREPRAEGIPEDWQGPPNLEGGPPSDWSGPGSSVQTTVDANVLPLPGNAPGTSTPPGAQGPQGGRWAPYRDYAGEAVLHNYDYILGRVVTDLVCGASGGCSEAGGTAGQFVHSKTEGQKLAENALFWGLWFSPGLAAAVVGRVSSGTLGAAETVLTLDASAIRFSQSSVNGVEAIANSMRASGWVGEPIDVVSIEGRLITVDNTRLLAAHLTGTPVQAVVHGVGDALPASMAGRFGTATRWGEAVMARIGGQNAAYRAANPLGSWYIGMTP